MLDIFNVDLKQTRFYQEVFAEGVAEGRVADRAWPAGTSRRQPAAGGEDRLAGSGDCAAARGKALTARSGRGNTVSNSMNVRTQRSRWVRSAATPRSATLASRFRPYSGSVRVYRTHHRILPFSSR